MYIIVVVASFVPIRIACKNIEKQSVEPVINMKKSELKGSLYVLVLVVIGLFIIIPAPVLCCERESNHTFLITGSEQGEDFNSLENLQQHLKQNSTGLGPGSSISICIDTPELNLTQTLYFSHYSRLTITGNSDNTTVTCKSKNASIIFDNITSSIELRNLKFVSCGAQIDIPTSHKNNNQLYYSAIIMVRCRDIEIRNVTVYKSHGVGLMVLSHQGGSVAVFGSTFEQNVISATNGELGGGGVFFGMFDVKEQGHVSIEFEKCTFKQNNAHTRNYRHIFTNNAGEEIEGYGRGGGLFLAFEERNSSSNINVSISSCRFVENKAFIGSGLSVQIGEVHEQNIKIFITDTLFEGNGCEEGNNSKLGVGLGGGAHISFNSYDTSNIYSDATLRNVKFNRNCAKHGGGVFIYSHKHDSSKTSNTLLFDECSFHDNHALTGSAVDTSPNIFKRILSGYTIIPIFRNCNFTQNKVYIATNDYTVGSQRTAGVATVYASLCDVTFEQVTLFKDNRGTAIYVVNGNVDFHNSDVRFENNSGIDGGALSLIGVSSMIVGPNSTYEFISNKALHRGGAIFVQLIDKHDFSLSRSCFFQYLGDEGGEFTPLLASKWTSNIIFLGNSATLGDSIFATSVLPCQVINNGSDRYPYYVKVDIVTAFETWGISFDEERNMTEHIVTHGGQLSASVSKLKFIPGHYNNHKVEIFDDLDTKVSEPFQTTISKVNEGGMVKLDETSSFFVSDKIQLTGEPGSTALLSLQVVSSRQTYITLTVELLDCPPGFHLLNHRCECDETSYSGIIGCNGTHSFLTPGFWAGVVEDKDKPQSKPQFATSTCPLGYCYAPNDSVKTKLPESMDDLENIICGPLNRKGVLCGSCQEHYTVYFHSVNYRCREEHHCHLGWLLYLVSELVPVTLVFVIVLLLNISFTSGAVNGFILFSQLLVSMNIDASGIVQLPNTIKPLRTTYTVIYGFFNLEFFNGNSTSFCLWKGASALDVIAFKYVTIAYALLLVVFVIWFMNRCGGRCLGKWCRFTTVKSSVIHGMSAFLIICYSQILKTSLFLVNGHELGLRDNLANFKLSKRVWYDGEMKQFGAKHLPYAIPALFSLIVMGTLPPILLLTYPLLNKVLDVLKIGDSRAVNFILRWIIPINTFKPLFDSFQGCFKDNMRFFAGLYFLYRWSALVSYTVTFRYAVAYTSTQVLFTVFLTLHSLCQPYIKRTHNIIDTLLFADIGLINFITLSHYNIFMNEGAKTAYKNEVIKTASIQMVLIFIPLIIFVVYVLAQGYNRVSSWYSLGKPGKKSRNNSDKHSKYYGVNLKAIKTLLRNVSSHSGSPDNVLDELPHRLIADNIDCDCFEDSEHTTESEVYREADAVTAY